MAGDWLKVEKDTPEKPEVLALAGILQRDPDDVFGKCFRFWRWADSQTADGVLRGVSPEAIDALIRCQNFAAGLSKVGWLKIKKGQLVIPDFARHMGESAKQRALTAKRVATHKRKKGNAEVTHDALPREEKSRAREEESPLPIAKRTKSDGKSMGASNGEQQNAGSVSPSSPSRPSPLGASEGEGEPFDLSDLNWERVIHIAESVAKKIKPLSTDDRRFWLKFAVLAEHTYSEAWLFDAVEAVLHAKQSNKGRQAHFMGVAMSKAVELGAVESEWYPMLRRIKIPPHVWNSGVVEVRR